MEYFSNPVMFQNSFNIPACIADNHLKLAGAVQLKVLLYVLRHLSDDPSNDDIANALKIPAADVADALRYWADSGIFIPKDITNTAEVSAKGAVTDKKAVKRTPIKPTREEVARRGSESEEIRFLLNEAQIKFGRMLKTGEASTLIWLYDDEGMDISLILMLIEYAVGENRCNIGFIERTAVCWIENGVSNISDAERFIENTYRSKTAWKIVSSAFGIDDRLPSSKELENSQKWVNEWEFSREMLKLAYEKCVDTKSKFIMSYVAKILESWHKSGYKTPHDVEIAEETKNGIQVRSKIATSDINMVEEMLNRGIMGD